MIPPGFFTFFVKHIVEDLIWLNTVGRFFDAGNCAFDFLVTGFLCSSIHVLFVTLLSLSPLHQRVQNVPPEVSQLLLRCWQRQRHEQVSWVNNLLQSASEQQQGKDYKGGSTLCCCWATPAPIQWSNSFILLKTARGAQTSNHTLTVVGLHCPLQGACFRTLCRFQYWSFLLNIKYVEA